MNKDLTICILSEHLIQVSIAESVVIGIAVQQFEHGHSDFTEIMRLSEPCNVAQTHNPGITDEQRVIEPALVNLNRFRRLCWRLRLFDWSRLLRLCCRCQRFRWFRFRRFDLLLRHMLEGKFSRIICQQQKRNRKNALVLKQPRRPKNVVFQIDTQSADQNGCDQQQTNQRQCLVAHDAPQYWKYRNGSCAAVETE